MGDPVYFVSLPGFAWYACLKITGVKFELITDISMLLMMERNAWWCMSCSAQLC